jgi:tRNA pseudouridine55 synthase
MSKGPIKGPPAVDSAGPHSSSLSPHPLPSGILNLDKPAGPTSHDVVARVRWLIKSNIQTPRPALLRRYAPVPHASRPRPKSKIRVGHGGTLDPAATGVLVVLLGAATRLAEYLGDLPKWYEARIRFGLRTDSQDTTGAVLSEDDASFLTEAAVREALAGFRGEILQTPPMVSALKVGGKRLYELARQGETVERAARPVTIYELRLDEFHPGREAWGQLTVRCSSGTYVRTLCADLGETLGCGAAMAALRRTAVGPFHLEEAVTLEAVEQAVVQDRLEEILMPPEAAAAHLPAVVVGAAEQARLLNGMAVAAAHPPSVPTGSLVRVLDESGHLMAIGRWEGHVVPVKVLASAVTEPRRGDGEGADEGMM